jgi:hypothetical protein
MTDVRGSAREWRLYIVTAVAGVYVLAWSRIGIAPQPALAPAAPATAFWLDELPPDARPVVSPPDASRIVMNPWHRSRVACPQRVRRAFARGARDVDLSRDEYGCQRQRTDAL